MRSILNVLSVTSAVLISTALCSQAQVTITRQPCAQTLCVSVPGVPAPEAGGTTFDNQDFDGTDGNCTVADLNGPFDGPWTYNSAVGTWSTAGQGPELGRAPSTRLTCPPVVVGQNGNVRVTIHHRHSFEDGGGNWDGGAIQISVNGSDFVTVPAAAFVANGYNGVVVPESSGGASELRGQVAFVSTSPGYANPAFITSIADLGCFSADDTIALRFLAAFDTNTRNGNPAWEIDNITFSDGVVPVGRAIFGVGASVVGEPAVIQWQRSVNGGSFSNLAGANSGFLVFTPSVTDNGNCYQALFSSAGTTVTSLVACLTVIQPNTAPQFVCGPNVLSPEDSGPQTLAAWATGIFAHSFGPPLPPVTYGSDFSSLPAGSQVFGNAAVSGGILHLTDASNSQNGTWRSPAITAKIGSYHIAFKALVGGGTCCGDPTTGNPTATADGFSVNVASDLPSGIYGVEEEGGGSGLSVCFDTWDNNAGEAPAIDVKVGGVTVASVHTQVAQSPDASLNVFKNVTIDVSETGLLNLTYDGTNVFTDLLLPNYIPQANLRLGMGGRTGGANENHWIDDLSITAVPANEAFAEASQTVAFIVNNDNPGLFSTQPAISPDGTLTYTPLPNACGLAHVTVVARDNGGTAGACGGRDTSEPCAFAINVACVNDCPTANSQSLTVAVGGSANFQVTGSDPEGDPLLFGLVSGPAHGTVVLSSSGGGSYTAAAGYSGPDSFTFRAGDGVCQSAVATVSITVGSANHPPTARIVASPLANFSPLLPNLVLISDNGSNACLTLDGSLSTDPESPASALTYSWFIAPSPTPFATGVLATSCVDLGTYTFVLAVTDPQGATGTASLTVDVLTACEADGALILMIENSTLPRNSKQSLISSVKNACAANEKFGKSFGSNQLRAFQNKVRTHVAPVDPVLAQQLTDAAQAIIDALAF